MQSRSRELIRRTCRELIRRKREHIELIQAHARDLAEAFDRPEARCNVQSILADAMLLLIETDRELTLLQIETDISRPKGE